MHDIDISYIDIDIGKNAFSMTSPICARKYENLYIPSVPFFASFLLFLNTSEMGGPDGAPDGDEMSACGHPREKCTYVKCGKDSLTQSKM